MESSFARLFVWILAAYGVYFVLATVCRICYNIYLHPLAKFPGPKWLAATWVPYCYYKVTGRIVYIVKDLHDEYGPVVRTGPNELAFVSGQAWRDIYGSQPGMPQNRRDPFAYTDPKTDELMRHNLLGSNDEDHARQRSHLAHAVSTRALQQQQPLISGHIDKFISKLHSSAGAEPQDMTSWFIWVTFDIIGDLAFGESFGCLDTATNHPWISTVYQGARVGVIMAMLGRFGIDPGKFLPDRLMKPRHDMVALCRQRLDKRLEMGEAAVRNDFTTFMLSENKKGDPAMTQNELYANTEVLAIAGSETSATLLTGMTFLLLTQRPDWLTELTESVRTTFNSDDISEMNFKTVTGKLPLLVATVTEALRMYPPVPGSHPRLIEVPGRTVDGHIIPVGAAVTVYQWAAGHVQQNWHQPDAFLPERWLNTSTKGCDQHPSGAFKNDRKDSMNPFSLGPRGCLGRNLAEVEIRLIFARLLWNFDLELVDGQQNWMNEQPALIFWVKGPLMLRLKAVRKT